MSPLWYLGDPERGFGETGEWGSKQTGSQEQNSKMTREQGAEESNLGSMELRICHKVMVFYTVEILSNGFCDKHLKDRAIFLKVISPFQKHKVKQ